jgi:L-serine deaminase
MRNTAQDVRVLHVILGSIADCGLLRQMHTNYKETSLGGLATSVRIPVSMPDC